MLDMQADTIPQEDNISMLFPVVPPLLDVGEKSMELQLSIEMGSLPNGSAKRTKDKKVDEESKCILEKQLLHSFLSHLSMSNNYSKKCQYKYRHCGGSMHCRGDNKCWELEANAPS